MPKNYSYNVNGMQTINLVNIVTNLNEVMDIVQGGGSGGLSDVQLKNINDKLNLLSNNLQSLTTDVDKYIDETELSQALKEIKDLLNGLVKSNDFTDTVNRLDTIISTINGEISNLKNVTNNFDLTDYAKKNEIDIKINDTVTDKVKNIENKVVTEVNKTVSDKITEKVTDLVGNIDTKISDKVTEVITTEKTDILRDVDSKVNGVVKETDLNKKLSKVAKIEEVNTFTMTNNFKDIGTENIVNSNNIKSLSINTDNFNTKMFKYSNIEVMKNGTDKFSIGVTDKDINLITKGKLLVNGVEFKGQEQTYTLPSTVVHNNVENTLTYKLNGTISNFNKYTINDIDVVIKDTNNDIVFGSSSNKTILKGTELYFNNDKVNFNLFAKTNDLTKYARLDIPNTFIGKITGNEIEANNIETVNLKVGGKNVVTDTTNFAKLDTSNTFTQKIKGTDIEINKLITNELMLNGVNVNLNDYTTNNNLISQLEKVIGLTYGGDIQNTNAKVVGKFYYDNINKYFYECIVNNNLTYIDNTKFKAISNKPLSVTNSLEIKIYTKTELLKLYRNLEEYIVDIVLIIYGKLAIYSGYFAEGDRIISARFEDKLCIFPVKAKHIMWGSDNLQVMNIGERCILKASNYFRVNGSSTCFQGVFIIE